ncbi:hypothetical protein EIN_046590, partial [Entamoeba invadens IP1]
FTEYKKYNEYNKLECECNAWRKTKNNSTLLKNATNTNQTTNTTTLNQKVDTDGIPIPQPINYNLTREMKANAVKPVFSFRTIENAKKNVKKAVQAQKKEMKKVAIKVNSNGTPNKTKSLKKHVKSITKTTHKIIHGVEKMTDNNIKTIFGVKRTNKELMAQKILHQKLQVQKSNGVIGNAQKEAEKQATFAIKRAKNQNIKQIQKAGKKAEKKAEIKAHLLGLNEQQKVKLITKEKQKAIGKAEKIALKNVKKVVKEENQKAQNIVGKTSMKELKKIDKISKSSK